MALFGSLISSSITLCFTMPNGKNLIHEILRSGKFTLDHNFIYISINIPTSPLAHDMTEGQLSGV